MKTMKTMFKSLLWAVMFALVSVTFFTCNAEEETSVSVNARTRASVQKPIVVVSGVISSNTTWDSDTVYQLDGKVYVSNLGGSNTVTLDIEAGTRIEGLSSSTPATASALVITRGSKIQAIGTESDPIVFTAENGTKGGWGGLVLLGKAPNNQGLNVLIEGIDPATAPAGVDVYYGGTDSCDNSGTLSYVRVEFAGASIATDNELNSFTFGSVGSGTQLDHLQAYYGADDGFEWFGGKVCAKYLISTAADDDAFDFDLGYTGKLQFLLAVVAPNASYSGNANGIECDNNAGGTDAQPYTRPVISNLTVVGTSTGTAAGGGTLLYGAHFRRATRFVLSNSILYGFKGSAANPAVIFLDGAAVSNWLGADWSNVCSSDSSYLTYDVIGLIPGAVPFIPANAVTESVATPATSAITLNNPFDYTGFFDASERALRPTGLPASSGASFTGLEGCKCCISSSISSWFTVTSYKGAIGPASDEYWIADGWVNTNFPIY